MNNKAFIHVGQKARLVVPLGLACVFAWSWLCILGRAFPAYADNSTYFAERLTGQDLPICGSATAPCYTMGDALTKDHNDDVINVAASNSSRLPEPGAVSSSTTVTLSSPNQDKISRPVFLPVEQSTRAIEIGAFLGISPPTASAVQAFEDLVGRHVYSVMWYQGWDSSGQPPFPCSDLVPVLYHDGYDTRIVFHLTWEPWVGLTDIANGVYDAYLTSYANAVKNCGLKVRLRFAHEMIEDDDFTGQEPYPWQDQPEQYKAAFRHVHDVFRAAQANNVEFVWCPLNTPFELSILQKYYPGPAYVDWLCFDGFKRNGYDWGHDWFGDLFYNIYHTFVDNVSIFGEKPVMIGEFASCQGPVKPAWITDALDQMNLNYPKIEAFYWFNVIINDCDFRVNSSPESLMAFRTAVSSTVFVSHPISTANQQRLFATTSVNTQFVIAEIDPTTGTVINSFPAPVAQGVSDGLAFDGTNLYYLSGSVAPNTLYALDPDTGALRYTYTLPANSFRDGLAYLNGSIYISEWSILDQDITIFNLATGTVIGRLDIDGANPGAPKIKGGLAAITHPDALLVTSEETDQLLVINPATGVISNTISYGRNGTLGVAVANGLIYLGANASNVLQIYTRGGALLGAVTIPGSIGVQSLGGDDVGPGCLEDVDRNGRISVRDIQLVAAGLGGSNPVLDINGSGIVDIYDIQQVATLWPSTCS